MEHRYHIGEMGGALAILLGRMLPVFLLPGLGLWLAGKRAQGRVIFGLYAFSALIFLIELGRPLSGWMFGLMIFLHTISLSAYLALTAPLPDRGRKQVRMGVMVCVYGLVYLFPLWHFLTHYAFLPLEMESRVYIVNPRASWTSLQRGDWVAYERPAISLPGYFLKTGPQLAQIYGLPGDRCAFYAGYFEIQVPLQKQREMPASLNRYSSWPGMPREGKRMIHENELFVWPKLINLTRYSGAALRHHAEMEQRYAYANALVERSQYRGRLYQRWFWRRQTVL